mmetsp:Transcript_34523/g.57991  ORF Transcript_34523/g.57991 Transcript_34523/m.57991 type:complete len:91 (-) Transcript_34523:629-901(-)|eukprot:CAMPEP_0198201988 /NCGR_PEP_ID=MMETSP1445-20131203/5030_1 /TAXON_ID=36898 /ORGANISM="Pyramimonas sp., Strain CCMP2087" /LENGTH=90 /DNA_ID=CAMNT_0043872679 /DNA_START=168 /DNA_END=440 /DNA_ORIENTATION=-
MEGQSRADFCTSEALKAGGLGAVKAGAVSIPAVYLAHTYLPTFRRYLGVSGKTALAFSPIFLKFFLDSELVVNSCSQKRGDYFEEVRKLG